MCIRDRAYKHEDGEVAVATLNALILAYQSFRRQIFVEGTAGIIGERRKETERQLDQNERAIARFLAKNNISDFESEQTGVRKRTEDLRAALNLLRAQMSETETALATVENQLRGTPREINLYVEDRASARIAQAELELKQLLAKYLPTSDPVRQKQAEVAELKALRTSNGGRAVGGRRVGPNTVHQELLTRRNTLQATADSYREKEFTLQRQLDSADNKVRRLTTLSPDYAGMLRERDTLGARLKSYNAKEQEALVNQEQAESTNENVKVISWPKTPTKGINTQLYAFAGASFAWGLTLFMLALLRVFLDPRLYAAPGPRRDTVLMPEPEYIPEPVTPQMPNVAAVATAAQPAAAVYDAAASQQPIYETFSQDYQNQQNYYASAEAVSEQQAYSQPSYDASAAGYYDPSYTAQVQDPQMQHDPNAYAQPGYDQNYGSAPYVHGSAAVDLNSNPYLSGQTAGAIDPNAQPVQAPYDPNAPQG